MKEQYLGSHANKHRGYSVVFALLSIAASKTSKSWSASETDLHLNLTDMRSIWHISTKKHLQVVKYRSRNGSAVLEQLSNLRAKVAAVEKHNMHQLEKRQPNCEEREKQIHELQMKAFCS